MFKRAARWKWIEIAGWANAERIRYPGQVSPWTRHSAQMYVHRHPIWRKLPTDPESARLYRQQLMIDCHDLAALARRRRGYLRWILGWLRRLGWVKTPRGDELTEAYVAHLLSGPSTPIRLQRHDQRPRTRDECRSGPRPCPWATCRHHMASTILAAARRGAKGLHWEIPREWAKEIEDGNLEVLPDSCALDWIEREGTANGEGIGQVMGLCRERIRQLHESARAQILLWEESEYERTGEWPKVLDFIDKGYERSKSVSQ